MNAWTASAGFHVLVLHEPARFVGSNRQDGEPERPVALVYLSEMAAVPIGRVTHGVNPLGGRFDYERSP